MNSTYPVAVSRARSLLTHYEISHPSMIDIEAIAMAQGAYVAYGDLAGAAARLVAENGRGIIRVSTQVKEIGQRRFCIAHELGHLLLHPTSTGHSLSTPVAFFYWYSNSKEEPEANAFAAELLMPESMFVERCKKDNVVRSEFERLSEEFRTTLTATAIRYVACGPTICAVVVCERGRIRWFNKNEDFRFRLLPPGAELHKLSVAYDVFEGKSAPEMPEEVPVTCWLEDDRISYDWTIGELTIPMLTYDSTLTILWPIPGSQLDSFEENGE